jgi:phosphomannomutase/phosphoglucomutase
MPDALDPHIFHAYDIRGTVGDQLTPESVDLICRAFGTRFRQEHPAPLLVVGRDLRVTSQEFAAVAMEALRATGCNVIDIGECPTPVVYFAIGHWGAHGGLGITASHNPPQYNGMKLRWTDRPFHGEKLQELCRADRGGELEQTPPLTFAGTGHRALHRVAAGAGHAVALQLNAELVL